MIQHEGKIPRLPVDKLKIVLHALPEPGQAKKLPGDAKERVKVGYERMFYSGVNREGACFSKRPRGNEK
ncbi:MAG: hypothetical protein BWY83_02839 [bacterium ADurb.Bin478]|nr:MAG: hypothetical protein BWY83_02839 [bacterium ADurb.Bin478]